MILNFWRPYPLLKPKKDGWYRCTVGSNSANVIDLYFDTWSGVWEDRRRKQVFSGYKVYKPGREPMEYNRVHTDSLCTRFDVIAWKKIEKPYFKSSGRKE